MNSAMQWFHTILDFFSEATIGRAIAMSLIGGVMLTQWVKFQMPEWMDDKQHAFWVRVFSSMITFALCLCLWPMPFRIGEVFAISVVTGLSAPTAYWAAVRLIYHYAPWMEMIISARPGSKDKEE